MILGDISANYLSKILSFHFQPSSQILQTPGLKESLNNAYSDMCYNMPIFCLKNGYFSSIAINLTQHAEMSSLLFLYVSFSNLLIIVLLTTFFLYSNTRLS